MQTVENTDNTAVSQKKIAMAALSSVFIPHNADPSPPQGSSPKTPNTNSASSQRAEAMAALNSVFTPKTPITNPTLSQRAAAIAALSSVQNFDPSTPKTSPPIVPSASSQRAEAMAALSSVLVQPGNKKKIAARLPGGGLDSRVQARDSSLPVAVEENASIKQKYSYEQLRVSSTDPLPDIDAKKRESYLSTEDFVKLLGVGKDEFYALPKWKQEQRKRAVDLF